MARNQGETSISIFPLLNDAPTKHKGSSSGFSRKTTWASLVDSTGRPRQDSMGSLKILSTDNSASLKDSRPGSTEQHNMLSNFSNDYMRVTGGYTPLRALIRKRSENQLKKQQQKSSVQSILASPKTSTATTKAAIASTNLRRRKELIRRRTSVGDMALVCVVFGLILLLLYAEVIAIDATDSMAAQVICWLILASTLLLLVFVFKYHLIELEISMINNGTDDWRVVISVAWAAQFGLETIICGLCPLPGLKYVEWWSIDSSALMYVNNSNTPVTPQRYHTVRVPLNVLFCIPMILRLYIACRALAAHSRLFTDPAARSIAALNRINVDFAFVVKTRMQEKPLSLIMGFTFVFWLMMTWVLTQCERHVTTIPNLSRSDSAYLQYANSLWTVIITFMSVGYGDIVPRTQCGRVVAIVTGVVGIVVAATLVAVVTSLLQLTSAERNVNSVLTDGKLCVKSRNAAARVLQQTWLIHKYRDHKNRGAAFRLMRHQRRFIQSMEKFRRIKWQKRLFAEKARSYFDNAAKVQNEIQESLFDLFKAQSELLDSLSELKNELKAQKTSQEMLGISQHHNCHCATRSKSASLSQTKLLRMGETC